MSVAMNRDEIDNENDEDFDLGDFLGERNSAEMSSDDIDDEELDDFDDEELDDFDDEELDDFDDDDFDEDYFHEDDFEDTEEE